MKVKLNHITFDKENLFVCFYMLIFFIRFCTKANLNISAFLWCISGFVLVIHIFLKHRKYKNIVIAILLINLISSINGFLNGNQTYIQACYNMTAQIFGIQIFLVKDKMLCLRNLWLSIYIYAVVKVLFFPYINEYDNLGISPLIGKNSISIIMLCACSIDVIYRVKNKIKINYSYFIIGIILSIITDSSGGILAFTVFLISMYMCQRNGRKLSGFRISLLILGSVIVVLYLGYITKIIEFLSDDNSRFALWGMYYELATKNIKSILVGGTLSENFILYRYQNIHNNFWNWHCFFGLFPMLLFTSIVIGEILIYLKQKNWHKLFICGVLFIRSVTDGTDYAFMSLWVFLLMEIIYEHKKNINGRIHYEKK